MLTTAIRAKRAITDKISENGPSVPWFPNVLPQEVQIHQAFGIGGQNELPRIATLGDMMRNVNHRDTGQTSHHGQNIRKRPVCPLVSPASKTPLFGFGVQHLRIGPLTWVLYRTSEPAVVQTNARHADSYLKRAKNRRIGLLASITFSCSALIWPRAVSNPLTGSWSES